MKAIILSAGQGRRLLPLTENLPKCALDVGGRAVLEWQLHEIARCAVDEVVVVTGFSAEAVDEIVAGPHDVPVRTLYNPFFVHCDNLGTCWVARHEMTGPFLIINGDTLFESAVLARLLEARDGDHEIVLATDSKGTYDDDDMKVIHDAKGRLERVGKQLDLTRVTGESIGMMRFDARGAEAFVAKLEYLMRYGPGVKQWYLSAIDELAQEGRVSVRGIDGLSWCEIDDPADLEQAADVVAAWRPGETAARAAGQ